MLFVKPISDLTHADVENFCGRFRENIRVEYKSRFDDSVKRKLPAIISSFANSYGGVLIIGVEAINGIAAANQEGIELKDPEPRLTIENICRANTYPELLPEIGVVQARGPSRQFIVISVNESATAPHAIENSRKVYVRTGDSGSPYDLADIDLILRLVRRRDQVRQRWDSFVSESRDLAHATDCVSIGPTLEIMIGPRYPSELVVSREQSYDFLRTAQLKAAYRFFNASLLRHNTGAYLVQNEGTAAHFFLSIGEHGTLFYRVLLKSVPQNSLAVTGDIKTTSQPIFPFWWAVMPSVRALSVFSEMLSVAGKQFQVNIEAGLYSVANKLFTLSFQDSLWGIYPVSTAVDKVHALRLAQSEQLKSEAVEICSDLVYQLRWPFGSEQPPTKEEVRRNVEIIVKQNS